MTNNTLVHVRPVTDLTTAPIMSTPATVVLSSDPIATAAAAAAFPPGTALPLIPPVSYYSSTSLRTGAPHKVAYRVWGAHLPAPAAVAFCVHGLTGNSTNFTFFAEYLVRTRGWRVVALDVIGRGRSAWLADAAEYSYAQYTRDVAAVIEQYSRDHLHGYGAGDAAAMGNGSSDHSDGSERSDAKTAGGDVKPKRVYVGNSMGGLIGFHLFSSLASHGLSTPLDAFVCNDVGPSLPASTVAFIKSYVVLEETFPSFADAYERVQKNYKAAFGPTADERYFRFITSQALVPAGLTVGRHGVDPATAAAATTASVFNATATAAATANETAGDCKTGTEAASAAGAGAAAAAGFEFDYDRAGIVAGLGPTSSQVTPESQVPEAVRGVTDFWPLWRGARATAPAVLLIWGMDSALLPTALVAEVEADDEAAAAAEAAAAESKGQGRGGRKVTVMPVEGTGHLPPLYADAENERVAAWIDEKLSLNNSLNNSSE